MIPQLQTVPVILVGVAIAFAVGFGGGFYTKGQFTKADGVDQRRADAKQTAKNVVESAELSLRTTAEITLIGEQLQEIKKVAVSRMIKRKSQQEKSNERVANSLPNESETSNDQSAAAGTSDGPGDDSGFVLDVGTVRLLNAARAGSGLDAAAIVAGEGQAAPAVQGQ